MKQVWALSAGCLGTVTAVAVMAAQLREDPGLKSDTGDATAVLLAQESLDLVESSIITENVYPIPVNAPLQASRVMAGGGPIGSAAGGVPTKLIYENTLSFVAVGPPSNLVNAELADDIATAGDFGCNLDNYVVRVTGDLNGDGNVIGNLNVETWLYESCPRGATNTPPTPRRIAGTQCQFSIPQASAGGVHDLTCQIGQFVDIPLRTNFFIGVRFTIPNRGDAGVVLGAPALLGFSQDTFDHPFEACGAGLGGFPAGPQASFYGKFFVREPCGDTFVGYKNTQQNERGFSPGAQVRFADDIRLNVPICNMVALEVSVKGRGSCLFDLRTCLDNINPETGCVIPGTRSGVAPTDPDVPTIGRISFDPPIPLSQQNALWASFRTTSANVGPIITGIPAGTGFSEDFYMAFRNGTWEAQESTNPRTWDAFSVTIVCDGIPPQGACCDMILTEDRVCFDGPRDGLSCNVDGDCTQGEGVCIGDSVCREGAEMNCPFPELWEVDGRCGPVCVGGTNNDQGCETDADCPGVCVGGSQNGQQCIAGGCKGGTCSADCEGSFCVGGSNNGLACSTSTDCPGASCFGGTANGQLCTTNAQCPNGFCRAAECPGPFRFSCGDSACCTFDDLCFDLTGKECFAYTSPDSPPDAPRMYQRGSYCGEAGQRCPFGACLGREGECTLGRDNFCVGGINDGDLCNYFFPVEDCPQGNCVGGNTPGALCFPGGEACPGQGATCRRAVCPGVPGCEDPFCCSDVCERDSYCCREDWDDVCAERARTVCTRAPGNDLCFHPTDPDRGALMMQIPGVHVGDGTNATASATDPDFCCWAPSSIPNCPPMNPPAYPGCDTECGPGGCGTLWYKFVAPEAQPLQTTSTVRISTCGSNFPADNSMIQIFSIPDSDRGKCGLDLSVCSVAAQNCVDGTECVFDEDFACANVSPVACADDTQGCSAPNGVPQPLNSRICVSGLVPGDHYYVMISGKVVQAKADYRLEFSSPCGVARPPIPNDLCANSADVPTTPAVIPFDLSGGTQYQPVTFDCPGPECIFATLQNDIWYDWTAPATGLATFQTCGINDDTTPDTGLVVYNGCGCPPSDSDMVGCGDFQFTPCLFGAKVTSVPVVAGNCYKVRLGGHLGGTPAGNLSISLYACLADCNNNLLCDECEMSCLNAGCEFLPGCGTAIDCNDNDVPDTCDLVTDPDCNNNDIPDSCDIAICPPGTPSCDDCQNNGAGNGVPDSCDIASGTSFDVNPANGVPDECESQPVAHLILNQATYPCDSSLPRLRDNTIRLPFDAAITAPTAGQVLISTIGAGGTFGPDLSANFTFTVQPGNVLKIVENGTVFANGTWYAIRNNDTWPGVTNFEITYAAVTGDSDNTLLNDFADLSFIFGNLTGAAADTDRSDMDASTFVDFADITFAFGFNGSIAPAKPTGHDCVSNP